MYTSKDNPHKPGTDEWKVFERSIMDRQRFAIGDEYEKAKAVADKRIKTATDQIRAQEEKGVWVDEVLEFLDGDKPEYDEILDGPVKIIDEVDNDTWDNVWKSQTPNNDPLNWNQLIGTHMNAQYMSVNQARQQYGFMYPVFKGTIVVPKFIPDAVERDSLFDKISTLQDYEFTEEEYNKGEVQVPIRTTLRNHGLVNYSANAFPLPSNQTYVVAQFYIRRKK